MGSVVAMVDAAAAEDVAAKPIDFFDIDSFNLDDFDFHLAADEFCDADAGNKQSSAGAAAPGIDDGFTGGESEGSSSPDSGVTDGPLAVDGSSMMSSMSAYMRELERYLLQNDDIGDDVCLIGEEGAEEELISVDDYSGDMMVVFHDGGVENADDGESLLATREEDRPRGSAQGT